VNAYVDASVLLRIVLGQPNRLDEWSSIGKPLSSQLVKVECLRTIDRAQIRSSLRDSQVADLRAGMLELIERFAILPLESAVLRRAEGPFPTSLGTLDALHLASALLARERVDDLVVATHDEELSIAARSFGFDVYGA
jgi:predicted nucleic acid-binding protein